MGCQMRRPAGDGQVGAVVHVAVIGAAGPAVIVGRRVGVPEIVPPLAAVEAGAVELVIEVERPVGAGRVELEAALQMLDGTGSAMFSSSGHGKSLVVAQCH